MEKIRYRIAKPSDAKEIAELHWHVRDRYTQGIFLSLGKGFLETYYKITLNDPWEVVICAVDENGRIIGFSSTTMDAREQADRLKKHKFKLAYSALSAVLLKPSLAIPIWQRYRSLSNESKQSFIHTEGSRGEYWCWKKGEKGLKAIEMSNLKNNILYELGVRELLFEVDKTNKMVYKYQLTANKAEPIEEIILPDGRVRVLMRKKIQKT